MLVKEIWALLVLLVEPRSVRQLAVAISSTYVRASQITTMLLQKGLAVKTNCLVSLANTAHATLFKKIASRYDIEKMVCDSKEDMVLALLSTNDIRGIQGETNLSCWTVKRALNKVMETDAVKKQYGKYLLADD
ncbi:MAG: hypothetical protein ACK4TI_04125, partial [Nitrososphaerales archaeon]